MPTASTQRIRFRKQDANNHWEVETNAVGSLSLNEKVAGAYTNRGLFNGVLAGHRVVIVCDGATIKGYSNNVLRWTYASATNFQASTAGEVERLGTSGVVSDIVTWPRTLSGAALAALSAV